MYHLVCWTLSFCRQKCTQTSPTPPYWSPVTSADPPPLLSNPLQATPSLLSRPLARTWWCRWALLSSCSAAVPRPCSGSGRSGQRCAERGRWTACPRSTSPGLSQRTWAATSAWRRARRREPTSTSTSKVIDAFALFLHLVVCLGFFFFGLTHQERTRADGVFCVCVRGWVCGEIGVCNSAPDRCIR